MNRRKFNRITLALPWVAGLFGIDHASALTLEELTQGEAVRGLRAALERGTQAAIQQLGRQDGFLGNEKVRIPLPRQLDEVSGWLRRWGQGGRLDELITSMNRAAEAAVPLARDQMLHAVRAMTIEDAKRILAGGDTSVTEFFASKTREPLTQKFLPVVTQTTQQVRLADQYNQLAGRAADFGMMRREDANIEHYVTSKALEGLYYVIGEEERKIRKDPVGTGSALLRKVFGAIN